MDFIPTPQDASLQIDGKPLGSQSLTLSASGAGGVLDLGQGAVDAADSGINSSLPGAGYVPGGLGKPMAFVINVGAITGTSPTFSVQAQESSDNATWTNCAGDVLAPAAVGVVAGAFFSRKRYLRLNWTLGGTSPTITYDAWANPNIGN
jgi:hypothetical protein